MQTPEEYLRDLLVGYCEVWGKPGHEWCVHGRALEGICPKGHSALALIRARDAEVSAQALREWLATWPNRYVGSPIYEDGMAYAEKIERGGA